LTDQDAAMSAAIKKVFPNTYHRLCVWHMYQNAAKHLSHLFNASKDFKHDFSHCVYDCEHEEEFITAWQDMLVKYNLCGNKWLADLFQIREKWALVYGRQYFCADTKSTQRSESINSVIKKYLDPKKRLLDFFSHWERLLEDRRHLELVADLRASQGTPKVPFSNMLKQVSRIYTPTMYKVFQKEYGRFLNCTIKDCGVEDNVHSYIIFDGRWQRTIQYNISNDHWSCSCLKFEFMGIQCCHIIKALDFIDVKVLPEKFFLKRWQINAKSGRMIDTKNIEPTCEAYMANRYCSLVRAFAGVISVASQSELAFNHLLNQTQELMAKMEELVLQDNIQQSTSSVSATKVDFETPHVNPAGVKKRIAERGSRRHPSCLEKKRKEKKKKTAVSEVSVPTRVLQKENSVSLLYHFILNIGSLGITIHVLCCYAGCANSNAWICNKPSKLNDFF
jgi:zinc finger SWIM domain-containing protein 3